MSAARELEGRRVVEFLLIIPGLKRGWYSCQTRLDIYECVKELRIGLASLLNVKCSMCSVVNMVRTCKSSQYAVVGGRRCAYYMNTKVALGEIASGNQFNYCHGTNVEVCCFTDTWFTVFHKGAVHFAS